jgi:hypothetical protein
MGPCLSKKPQADTESESSRNHRPRRETPPRQETPPRHGDTPRHGDASRSASREITPRAASEGVRSRSTPREAHPGSGDLPRSVSGGASLRSGDVCGPASPEILLRTDHPPRSDFGGADLSSRPMETGQRPHKGGSSKDTPRAAPGGASPESDPGQTSNNPQERGSSDKTTRSDSGSAGRSTGPRGTGKRSHEIGSAIDTSRSASRGASPRSNPGETSKKSHETPSSNHTASSTSGGAGPGPDAGEMNQMPQKKELSQLEGLPGPAHELLILLSRNPNLARVSRQLNEGVSTERVYRILILYALFNNDEEFPVRTSHFQPIQYEHLTAAERSALGRKVLECGWCTYSRIKNCLPDLIHLVLAREYAKKYEECVARLSADAFNDFETLTGFFQPYHVHIREDIICTSISNPVRPAFIFDYIPRKALDPGTWNYETTDYLLFIRQHLANDPQRVKVEFDTASMTRGIETAIKQHKVKALYTLLVIEHICCLRKRCNLFKPYLPSALPDSLFGLACHQGQHSKWILELLVLARHHVIPHKDPDLRRWLVDCNDNPRNQGNTFFFTRMGQNFLLVFERSFTFKRMLSLEFTGPYECPRMSRISCFEQA